MKVENFIKILDYNNSQFFVGVPDSHLKALSDYLYDKYKVNNNNHIIAVNEGNAVAIAAGHHLSTRNIPIVYLQNSGIGNIVNPVTSLLNDKVYGIPCIFIIGWRGEPGVKDEPQHLFQGEITIELLENIGISTYVVEKEMQESAIMNKMEEFKALLSQGKSVAFVIQKDTLSYQSVSFFQNQNKMVREEIIKSIIDYSKNDIVVSTTGKTSRELFEAREFKNQSHQNDFLTVGSMGHSSSIAYGIAISKPDVKVWCIDGDGAALMHLGAMGLIGSSYAKNYIHVVINNEAHESVGGQPTIANKINFCDIAKGCGYQSVFHIKNEEELHLKLKKAILSAGPIFIEIESSIGSRDNLGRPTTSPLENKKTLMNNLKGR